MTKAMLRGVSMVVMLGMACVVSAQDAPPPPRSAAQQAALDACVASHDDACVVRMLGGGRARGADDLLALLSAQRSVVDRPGACVTARQLQTTTGVPPARQAMVRQYIAAQCP